MTTKPRSAKSLFVVTAISLIVAVATGASWIGQPFRAVQLLMLLGLGATAGVSWAQAIARVREAPGQGGAGSTDPGAGVVLYAADMERVAAFYALLLGARVTARDEEYVLLKSSALELVVRQISPGVAERIRLTVPPARREDSAAKLVFFVAGLEPIRAAIAAHGGALDPAPKPWLFRGRQVWDALDPEGNVIQLRVPAA